MVEHSTQQRLAEYLTVGEAADFLGVSPWTLRNWDRAGRLKAVRHPKNGYRIYREQDLEAVLDPGDVYAQRGNRAIGSTGAKWGNVSISYSFMRMIRSSKIRWRVTWGWGWRMMKARWSLPRASTGWRSRKN